MSIPSNNLLVKNLVEYGLTENESKAYLTLLELQNASANEIAKASGIKRSSIYVILDSLKKQGLVGISNDNKIQNYVATSPEALMFAAKEKSQKQEEIKNKIDSIIPELKALYKETKKGPKVKIFEGKIGLVSALESTLINKEKIVRGFSTGDNILNMFSTEVIEWTKRRAAKDILFEAIYIDNKSTRILVDMFPHKFKVVFVPPDKYPFPVDMIIWDNQVGYLIVEGAKITTIVIESKEAASMMRGMFDMAFEQARSKWGKYEESLD